MWLFSNNITWIEAGSFSELRDLEELDLGDNSHLRRLEGGAFRGLEKLQSLHMHRCKLTALPHDLFHKLYSLQFLYLQVGAVHIYSRTHGHICIHTQHAYTHTTGKSHSCENYIILYHHNHNYIMLYHDSNHAASVIVMRCPLVEGVNVSHLTTIEM